MVFLYGLDLHGTSSFTVAFPMILKHNMFVWFIFYYLVKLVASFLDVVLK